MLVGRPSDKQGLPVGLYNPIFDEFMALMSDTITDTDITHDHLSNTSTFCSASVAIYRYEHERRQAMTHMVDDLVYAPLTGMLAHNKASSDGTIMSIAHGMSLYRAILEWINDMGEGGCDAVKQDVILSETIGSNQRAQYSSWFIFPFDPYVLIVRTCSECKQLPQFHHCNFRSMVSWPRSCFRGVSSHLTFDGLYLVGSSPSADTQLLRVARLFVALRRALQSLDTFYTKLNIPADSAAPTNLARFFLHIQSFSYSEWRCSI